MQDERVGYTTANEKHMIQALTYDDIQLVPGYSDIASRKNISLKTHITRNYQLDMPLVASPMDTVCDADMAIAMMKLGGLGVIHRFMSVDEQYTEACIVKDYRSKNGYELPIAAAVGANGDFLQRAKDLIYAGVDIILIDVAHGHHKNVKEAIKQIKDINDKVDVIAGNIATAEAADDLWSWGADGLRVGIGGGSLCTTRIKTGFGVPNATCLQDIVSISKIPVMADGGIRTSGDIDIGTDITIPADTGISVRNFTFTTSSPPQDGTLSAQIDSTTTTIPVDITVSTTLSKNITILGTFDNLEGAAETPSSFYKQNIYTHLHCFSRYK